MPIRAKRVYDPVEPDDGLRVLVTYYWPRGVSKSAVDRWYRALGVPPRLLAPWLQESISADEFKKAYLAALDTDEARELINELARLAVSRTVTLLTSVRDMQRSHVWLLKEIVEQRQQASGNAPAGSGAPADRP